jgi:hypothetical protein
MCKAHYQRWWRTGQAESDGFTTYSRVRNGKQQTVKRRLRSTETGYSRTKLYRAWASMMGRCYLPDASNYRWYGGKGVKVHESWHDFLVFRKWAESHGYAPGMELDREDKEKDYGPRNCRYITKRANLDRKGRQEPVVTLRKRTYRSVDRVAAAQGLSVDTVVDRIIQDWLTQQSAAVSEKGRR